MKHPGDTRQLKNSTSQPTDHNVMSQDSSDQTVLRVVGIRHVRVSIYLNLKVYFIYTSDKICSHMFIYSLKNTNNVSRNYSQGQQNALSNAVIFQIHQTYLTNNRK